MRLDDHGNNAIFNHRAILLVEKCYSNGRPVHNVLVSNTHGEMDIQVAREAEVAVARLRLRASARSDYGIWNRVDEGRWGERGREGNTAWKYRGKIRRKPPPGGCDVEGGFGCICSLYLGGCILGHSRSHFRNTAGKYRANTARKTVESMGLTYHHLLVLQ